MKDNEIENNIPLNSQENSTDQRINNILLNLYNESSGSEESLELSELSLDERYFLSEEVDCLSKQDFKKLKKCRVGHSKTNCSVCLEKFVKNQVILILPCHHKFHYKCMKPWFGKSTCCPLCRLDIKKHFNPSQEVPSVLSESSPRNPLLDESFIQPRILTPYRSARPSRRR